MITIEDIEASTEKAWERHYANAKAARWPFDDDWRRTLTEWASWLDVLERVKAGRDPTLAVMERE